MAIIRRITDNDISIIKNSPQYPPEFEELDYALRDNGWLDEYHSKSGTDILLAEDNDRLVGFSILSKDTEDNTEFRIAILPRNLGKGYGKTIALLTLQHFYSSSESDTLWLIVRKNNPRAIKLYHSLNFRQTGECTEEVNGKMVDFYRMEINRQSFYDYC
jgi:RimJ/RimL family protein N-acetyltransferase